MDTVQQNLKNDDIDTIRKYLLGFASLAREAGQSDDPQFVLQAFRVIAGQVKLVADLGFRA